MTHANLPRGLRNGLTARSVGLDAPSEARSVAPTVPASAGVLERPRPTPERPWPGGRAGRVAFFTLAAVLAVLVSLTVAATTALTIGLWLVGRNQDTSPVVDLGFFALGAVVIAVGFAAQLHAPERSIAGVQQAIAGLLALGIGGLLGRRVEPLTGSAVLLAATALLAALHPARHDLRRLRPRPSLPLIALALVADLPAVTYAATMLALARQAGPSCFLGRCAAGDRFAEIAALALAVVALGLLAAMRPQGWRVTARSTGAAVAIVGAASIVLPDLPGALGRIGGALAITWGVLFVAVAEGQGCHGTAPLQHEGVPQ